MSKVIADRYMVVTSLGEGGMADVYLAVDTILNREVAVKILRGELSEDPVALLRFLREASAVSKLHHPNVVEVYDVGEYDNKNYIIMEYIRGRTLKQLIAQRGALQKEEAVETMKQLVSAVSHAHENNIIHRDIKPQNILIKDDGTVKITDFGIALAHDAIQLTQSDAILGSAHYIAPETTRGESATVQIDIYALGVVFYELLTGTVPFKGDNPIQIAMKHLREDIPSVKAFNPTLPQSVENIVIKATAKNRIKRYATAKDMLFDLEMCLLPEFQNVEKTNFNYDEEDEGTVVLDRIKDIEGNSDGTREVASKNMEYSTNEKATINKPSAKNKKEKLLKKVIAAFVALALLSAGTAGIYFSGMVEGFSPIKLIAVPNLEGIKEKAAKNLLEEKGLKLDAEILEEVTDNTGKGLIIKQTPSKNSKVKKGATIKITISSGNYFVVENYVGKNISEVETFLEENKITIIKEYRQDQTTVAGTILEQSILDEGDKIKPGVNKQIRFIIASSPEFVMANYEGAKIETAKATLEKLGAKVVLEKMEMPKLGEEENAKLPETGVVIRQSPEAGSYYTQQGESVITLYYY